MSEKSSLLASGAPDASDHPIERAFGADGSSPPKTARRRRLGLVTLILTALVVVLLVVVPTAVLLPRSHKNEASSLRYTFDNFIDGDFRSRANSVRWMPAKPSSFVYSSNSSDINEVDLSDEKVATRVFVSASDLTIDANGTLLDYSSYQLSERYPLILFHVRVEKIYRHSAYRSYYTYVVNEGDPTVGVVEFPTDNSPLLQYAEMSPNTTQIAYVLENNIFVADIDTTTGRVTNGTAPVQVTLDGVPHVIYNGVPDWVYEEEVLSSDHAMWWSADGRFLCYMRFNDTDVHRWTYPYYGSLQYEDMITLRYPKAGTTNPLVSVHVYDTVSGSNVNLDLGEHLYFTQVVWSVLSDPPTVYVRRLNRYQNESTLVECVLSLSGSAPVCTDRVSLTSSTGWLATFDGALRSVRDGTLLLDIVADPTTTYPQVVSYDTASWTATMVTAGEFEVMSIDGFSDVDSRVLFTANLPTPHDRHAYSIRLDGTNMTCQTCNFQPECAYESLSYPPTGPVWRYVSTCYGPAVLTQHIRFSAILDPVLFEANSGVSEALSQLSLGTREFMQVPGADGSLYDAVMLRPPTFSPSRRYPVLFKVYGGPGSQEVTSRHQLGYSEYLASSLGYIVFSFDGRGTAGRGMAWRHLVYKQLGKYEAQDCLLVAQYLKTLPYVDASRVAIWGWSYGGYLTSMTFAQSPEIQQFAAAVAVAPVTDWLYYDSIYTERYMSLPSDNSEGYAGASVLTRAPNVLNDSFLLVHGTGDDNVHFQNTAMFNLELVRAQVRYRVQFYTNQDHGINRDGSTRHLYRLITNTLQSTLGLSPLLD